MSTDIFYNSNQILVNQPTPYVGREESMVLYGGNRWADKTTLTLHGQITGCTFASLLAAQNTLIGSFSKDFQSFQIIENSNTVFQADYTMVRSVDFPSANYNNILNYTVTLDCYQQNLFSGVFGVLDPVDEWTYEESLDFKVSLVHTTSARGFNTSATASNSLENARNFVGLRTGLTNQIAPALIQAQSGNSLAFCLKEVREKIDRFNGVYGLTETYVADAFFGLNGVLRYTTDYQCSPRDGITKVAVQGDIEGWGRATTMEALRARYSGTSLYTIASDAYTSAGGTGSLNTLYNSNGITEDPFNKKISFNAVYDNNLTPTIYLDYSVSLDVSENDITSVNFQGVIKGRGDINTRWSGVVAYYQTLDPYSYALAAYNTFSPASIYPLNSIPTNESTSFNQFNAEISVSKVYDNKDVPPGGFKTFNYTLHFTPSFEKVAYNPLAGLCVGAQQYYIVDLGYHTRCHFSVDGNGKICLPNSTADGRTAVRNFGNSMFTQYCPSTRAVLESDQLGNSNDTVTFNFGWTAVSANSLTTSGSYALVNNLNLK